MSEFEERSVVGTYRLSSDEASKLLGVEATWESIDVLDERARRRLKKTGVDVNSGIAFAWRRIDYKDDHGILVLVGRATDDGNVRQGETVIRHFISDNELSSIF